MQYLEKKRKKIEFIKIQKKLKYISFIKIHSELLNLTGADV